MNWSGSSPLPFDPLRAVTSEPGANQVRTPYLINAMTYQVPSTRPRQRKLLRLIYRAAIADPVPTSAVTGVQRSTPERRGRRRSRGRLQTARIASQRESTVNPFGAATLVATEYGAPNAPSTRGVSLAAGTYYAWLVAINPFALDAPAVATGVFTVI